MLVNVLITLVLLLFSGCSLRRVQDDLESYSSTIPISGTVTTEDRISPVIVAYYQYQGSKSTLLNYAYHYKPEAFKLILPIGRYQIIAFQDQNRNFRYDDDELIFDQDLNLTDSISIQFVDVVLQPNDSGVIYSLDFSGNKDLNNSEISWTIGDVYPISAEVISEQFGVKAYTEPMAFAKTGRFGIYFHSDYDTSKIPLLFIHGAAGTPSDFEEIVNAIDTTRYQAWTYFYPSGAKLAVSVEILQRLMNRIKLSNPFNQIGFVAHSMGGLVARNYIVNHYNTEFYKIPFFISLSTPWEGHAGAAAGVERSPLIIPSWIDMSPQSPFIEESFETTFPDEIDFYLLFGVRGGLNRYTGTNDETVSIASQLRREAQLEAEFIRGYDETHTSILHSPLVIEDFNRILTEFSNK